MDKDYALFLASMVSNLLIDGILLFIFRAYIEGLIKHREKEYEHSESIRTHFYDLLVIVNDATLDCILNYKERSNDGENKVTGTFLYNEVSPNQSAIKIDHLHKIERSLLDVRMFYEAHKLDLYFFEEHFLELVKAWDLGVVVHVSNACSDNGSLYDNKVRHAVEEFHDALIDAIQFVRSHFYDSPRIQQLARKGTQKSRRACGKKYIIVIEIPSLEEDTNCYLIENDFFIGRSQKCALVFCSKKPDQCRRCL